MIKSELDLLCRFIADAVEQWNTIVHSLYTTYRSTDYRTTIMAFRSQDIQAVHFHWSKNYLRSLQILIVTV